ncbi:D-arabinono-1,4-lactone oxidase [Microbacterium sp. SORGH_AS_0888]|uniref:D-arabinono-1,4-lactone oxidase n=1 Tax=Microbacterium sp. SORGH_AS_0888 TaxID=3041791 RepID=UPI0027831864|nr:D-arabinono-1,4-lactone oxidase [Microbacterium sp. SORGH_AS_0888]MDQ1128110.1 FAD-linked oxidoreductase [Microbacterium sp. SORGH_AS_0888]
MTRPGGVWRNWARSASVRPVRIEFPASTAAVQRAVRAAAARGLPVKAVGSGHSFSEIAVAPGILLDLRDLTGLVSVDRERRRVTLRAGTRLRQIPHLLAPYGWAMTNLGDIDRQTIAGAISTGTHGTGARFGGLSTQVVGVTVVTADGDLLRVDESHEPELLPALALSLGALGVLVEVTVQVVPAFLLRAVERREGLDDLLPELADRAAGEDHFEFYWFPRTDVALTKSNARLPESEPRQPLPRIGGWIEDTVLSNHAYRAMCAAAAAVPALSTPLARLGARTIGARTYTDRSHRVFTQDRDVRFREMEYAVPVERLPAVFGALRELVDTEPWPVSFPVEVRIAEGDDRWMSTAYERDSGYIAVHRYWREDPTSYFRAVEELMQEHDGRPHWGKMHTLDAAVLRSRYPRFDDFLAVRDRLDPQRRFANAYLDRVLGQ